MHNNIYSPVPMNNINNGSKLLNYRRSPPSSFSGAVATTRTTTTTAVAIAASSPPRRSRRGGRPCSWCSWWWWCCSHENCSCGKYSWRMRIDKDVLALSEEGSPRPPPPRRRRRRQMGLLVGVVVLVGIGFVFGTSGIFTNFMILGGNYNDYNNAWLSMKSSSSSSSSSSTSASFASPSASSTTTSFATSSPAAFTTTTLQSITTAKMNNDNDTPTSTTTNKNDETSGGLLSTVDAIQRFNDSSDDQEDDNNDVNNQTHNPPVGVAKALPHDTKYHSTTTTILLLMVVTSDNPYQRQRIQAIHQAMQQAGQPFQVLWDRSQQPPPRPSCPFGDHVCLPNVETIPVSTTHRFALKCCGLEKAIMWPLDHYRNRTTDTTMLFDYIWIMEEDVHHTDIQELLNVVLYHNSTADLLHQNPILNAVDSNWYLLDIATCHAGTVFANNNNATTLHHSMFNLFRLSTRMLDALYEFYHVRNHQQWVLFEALLPTLAMEQTHLTLEQWTESTRSNYNYNNTATTESAASLRMRYRPCFREFPQAGIYHPVKIVLTNTTFSNDSDNDNWQSPLFSFADCEEETYESLPPCGDKDTEQDG